MFNISNYWLKLLGIFPVLLLIVTLTACALPDKPVRAQAFDFGSAAAVSPAPAGALQSTIVLPEIESSAALDGNAMVYRLAFANPQVLNPYASARWSMAPAQLLRQRLREQLGQNRVVLSGGEAAPAAAWLVRTELDEFAQVFESASQSQGQIRLRATVTQAGNQGEKLLGQRSFVVQRPATGADAAGGARALALAADGLAQELDQWLRQLR